MFRIITPDQFVTSRWKNGGGVTHEIARHELNSAWVWRLSIAEVATNGPFSHFAGLSRILTVIEGNGIELHTPDAAIKAKHLEPVHFSGDAPVDGRLVDGPIRDLNVIFDGALIDAHVESVAGPRTIYCGAVLAG
ncbi:MAG: HutD/Ves family protein, partial [Rhizobiaceae bacterium]